MLNLSGHLWTIGAFSRRGLDTPEVESEPWRTRVPDPRFGSVRLTGHLHRGADDRLLILVHGLGGSAESPYLLQSAAAAVDRGWSALRINLRGSDGSGEDYYHAGLSGDLHAVLATAELDEFEDIALMGFSLGGHMALRAATEPALDSRVRAVAAISAPLSLEECCQTIDLPSRWPYRRYMLSRLVDLYTAVAARREVPTPLDQVRRIRRFRDFDDQVVAPRFGFASAEDYYARASVGPRLDRLRVPALYVGSRPDPMVPVSAVEPWVERVEVRSRMLTVHWQPRGGHVAFPADLDLGESGPQGIYAQTLAWLSGHPPPVSVG